MSIKIGHFLVITSLPEKAVKKFGAGRKSWEQFSRNRPPGVDFLKIALNSYAVRLTFNWDFWLDWATGIYENLSFSDAQLKKKQSKSWAYVARVERNFRPQSYQKYE